MNVATSMNSIDLIVKSEVTKILQKDFILIHITEISIKSYASPQISRPAQKKFSRISSYLLWHIVRSLIRL